MDGLGQDAGLQELIEVRAPQIQVPAAGAMLEPVVAGARPPAVAKPIAQLALGASLRRLARQLTAGALPLRPAPERLPVGGGPGS